LDKNIVKIYDKDTFVKGVRRNLEVVLSKLLTYKYHVRISSRYYGYYSTLVLFVALEYIFSKYRVGYKIIRNPSFHRQYVLVVDAREFRKKFRIRSEKKIRRVIDEALEYALNFTVFVWKNKGYECGNPRITNMILLSITNIFSEDNNFM